MTMTFEDSAVNLVITRIFCIFSHYNNYLMWCHYEIITQKLVIEGNGVLTLNEFFLLRIILCTFLN